MGKRFIISGDYGLSYVAQRVADLVAQFDPHLAEVLYGYPESAEDWLTDPVDEGLDILTARTPYTYYMEDGWVVEVDPQCSECEKDECYGCQFEEIE